MNRLILAAVSCALLAGLPTSAQAELRHVEIKTLGMD
jgi:hypothetical protein